MKMKYKRGVHNETGKCEENVNWQIDLKYFCGGFVKFWKQTDNIKYWVQNSDLKNKFIQVSVKKMSAQLNKSVWEKKELTEWFKIYFWMLCENMRCYRLFLCQYWKNK